MRACTYIVHLPRSLFSSTTSSWHQYVSVAIFSYYTKSLRTPMVQPPLSPHRHCLWDTTPATRPNTVSTAIAASSNKDGLHQKASKIHWKILLLRLDSSQVHRRQRILLRQNDPCMWVMITNISGATYPKHADSPTAFIAYSQDIFDFLKESTRFRFPSKDQMVYNGNGTGLNVLFYRWPFNFTMDGEERERPWMTNRKYKKWKEYRLGLSQREQNVKPPTKRTNPRPLDEASRTGTLQTEQNTPEPSRVVKQEQQAKPLIGARVAGVPSIKASLVPRRPTFTVEYFISLRRFYPRPSLTPWRTARKIFGPLR